MTNISLHGQLFGQCVLMAFVLEGTTHNLFVNLWPTAGERPGLSETGQMVSGLLWPLHLLSVVTQRKKEENHPNLQVYPEAGVVTSDPTKTEPSPRVWQVLWGCHSHPASSHCIALPLVSSHTLCLRFSGGESCCLFSSLQWRSPGTSPWCSCSMSVCLLSHLPKHMTTFKGWTTYICMKNSITSPCLSWAPPLHKQLCFAYSMDIPFQAPVTCQAWCQARNPIVSDPEASCSQESSVGSSANDIREPW